MLCQQLAMQPLRGCWLLRLPAGAPVGRLARQARLSWRLLTLLGLQTVQYLVWLLAWWLIGCGALAGRLDVVWLLTWALLLLTLIPCRLLSTWLQGLLAIGAGGLLKQRLLAGALKLEPDDIRHQGIGQFLGRVLESDTMETLALHGGFLGLVAVIELGLAMVILGSGAGGWWHVLVLLGWLAGTGIMSWRYVRQRRHWTATRLTMTHDMVERMVGHRTRLAQEAHESWHDGEDQAVEGYLTQGRKMDGMMAWMLGVVPRGWLVLGLLGLIPAFSAGSTPPAALAVSLGGTLLAYRALHAWCMSLVQVADAGIAWLHIAPIFHAAARPEAGGAPTWTPRPSPQRRTAGETVLEARDLVFRYRHRGGPILCGCSVRLAAGDRVLLQGTSGGGKSTLAAVLTGIRQPESGLLLLRGVDQPTLGVNRWRRHVVAAPQFHDNHVLTGTLAFNLLLGRRWPPRHEDMQEAEAVCRALGLGELLDRMPAGLLQMVGETGWQLSHGERSRLYLARALLQNADLVVLDESFAALDPENLQHAVRCVRERAATLLVIAHP
jgi:ATP-binding cassette subfamily B protein